MQIHYSSKNPRRLEEDVNKDLRIYRKAHVQRDERGLGTEVVEHLQKINIPITFPFVNPSVP